MLRDAKPPMAAKHAAVDLASSLQRLDPPRTPASRDVAMRSRTGTMFARPTVEASEVTDRPGSARWNPCARSTPSARRRIEARSSSTPPRSSSGRSACRLRQGRASPAQPHTVGALPLQLVKRWRLRNRATSRTSSITIAKTTGRDRAVPAGTAQACRQGDQPQSADPSTTRA